MRIPIFIVCIFLFLYGAMNYYVGLRGWQALSRLLAGGASVVYWCVIVFAASSVFLGMFLGNRLLLPEKLREILTIAGFYWLVFLLYLFLAFVVLDLGRFMNRWLRLLPDSATFPPLTAVTVILLLVAGIIVYGVWNAQNIKIRHYEVEINKNAGNIEELQLVMVSDLHMGNIVNRKRISRMVEMVNGFNPDLIVIPGDIIDGNLSPYLEQNMNGEIGKLKAKLGVWGVFGNHDYIGGIASESQRLLREAGVTVLRDEYRLVEGSFYLVGREDVSSSRLGGQLRRPLAEIMAGMDMDMPILLLDHQPFNLDEGREQGVDLQLSGHTHHGQLFPFNLLTANLFEQDWGYLSKDSFLLIVSCGFGTWGPPLRIGSVSEIVTVTVRFK